jgi:hypothetical protein
MIPVLATDMKENETLVVLDRQEPESDGQHKFMMYWKVAEKPQAHVIGRLFKADLQEFIRLNPDARVVTREALRAAHEGRKGWH